MRVDVVAALVSHLDADDVIRGLLGDAIFRDVLPSDREDTLYIIVQHLGAIPGRHLTAVSGYTEAFVQINVWGRGPEQTRVEVEEVADAIREALDHMTQTTLGTPPDDVAIGVIELERNPDDVVRPRRGEESVTYIARQTARIEHTESVPTFA